MSDPETEANSELVKIRQMLEAQEQRLVRVEAYLGLPSATAAASESEQAGGVRAEVEGEGLEMKIGEFGLAWVGGIVFILGIIFLMTYTLSLGHQLTGVAMGYASSLLLYWLARSWKKSIPFLSRLTEVGSLVLLFYSTVRLHFFSAAPLIGNLHLGLFLLVLVLVLHFTVALRRGSQPLAILAAVLGQAAAVMADSTHLTLSMAVALSVAAVVLAVRKGWWNLACGAIPLAYATHLVWLLGNPLMGHSLGAVREHQFNLIYLFVYAAVFALPSLYFTEESPRELTPLLLVVFNCAGFSFLLLIISFAMFRSDYSPVYFGAAILLIALAIAQWLSTRREFAPSLYASFGFLALSIAFYGYAGIPNVFLWLAMQSLLVVSLALWFRSRLLVVANSLIFIGILTAYLFVSATLDTANFGFALVAHLSARIMNWQKERLTLRTATMRNLFLLVAFVFMMYAIYHAAPVHYRSLAWTCAAGVYFALSLALRNMKYRWMALGALTGTILNLFFVDLRQLDPRYRVAAFLFLGMIAVLLSLFYAKLRRFLVRSDKD